MAAQPVHRDTHVDRSAALRGPAYEWALWSTTVRVVTADPRALPSARRLIDAELGRVELAASRVRNDSEVATLATGRRTRISATLTAVLAAALRAARDTDGAVDPIRARGLQAVDDASDWRGVELDERAQTVFVPRGAALDLDMMARAWAADRCASVVGETLDVGVLVNLGGHISTAGPAGGGAWQILVGEEGDHPAGRGALVAIPTGLAVVTASSETSHGFCTATVIAEECVTAATWAVAAVSDARAYSEDLVGHGLPARLVGADGAVTYCGGWPENAELRPVEDLFTR
jgi:thiamine biosynthesis lipoprotein